MRFRFLSSFVFSALLLVGGMGSPAHAQQRLQNGDFNANPPTKFWTLDRPNLQTAPGVTGQCIWLNLGGDQNHDPSVSQDMTNLTPNARYVVLGQYKVGRDAYLHAKPGDKMLAVDIDGETKITAVAPTAPNDPKMIDVAQWLTFAVSFTATKTTHRLRIRGEIEGKDADVYIDEVSVTPAQEHLSNGNFDNKLSANDWKLENINPALGGYQTEPKDGKSNGYVWVNGPGGVNDPAIVQTMRNLKVGQNYIISCQYRTGRDAEGQRSMPGNALVAITIDGAEKSRAFAPSAKGDSNKLDKVSWNSVTVKFKATKAEHVLKIVAELAGVDADVDIDNISVVPVE